MLGYAKLFRDRIRAEGRAEGKAEGRAEVYRQLEQARKEGKTLEEILETNSLENSDDVDTDRN